MEKYYGKVRKMGDMARFMLLYIQKTCFYRKSASRFLHNSLNPKAIHRTRLSANSVNFCKFAENPHMKSEPNPMTNLNKSTKCQAEIGQRKTSVLRDRHKAGIFGCIGKSDDIR